MAIPTFNALMFGLLKMAGDKNEHGMQNTIQELSQYFHLSDKERMQLRPSGGYLQFNNKVAWVKKYLLEARLIKATKKGYFMITDRGLNLLQEKPDKIDTPLLMRFPEFVKFKNKKR